MCRHEGKGNEPSHRQKYFHCGVAYNFHTVSSQQHVSRIHVHPNMNQVSLVATATETNFTSVLICSEYNKIRIKIYVEPIIQSV